MERRPPRQRALLWVLATALAGVVLAIVTAPTSSQPEVDPYNPDNAVPFVGTTEGAQP